MGSPLKLCLMASLLLLFLGTPAFAAKARLATDTECPAVDDTCSDQVFSAGVDPPTCPDGLDLDDQEGICRYPCSELNTATTIYKVKRDDISMCVPSCPTGFRSMGIFGDAVNCVKCSTGYAPRKISNRWKCYKAGTQYRTATVKIRTLEERGYEEASCEDGSLPDPDGNCYSCPADINPDVAAYAIIKDGGSVGYGDLGDGPICVPETCCTTATDYTDYTDYGDYSDYGDYGDYGDSTQTGGDSNKKKGQHGNGGNNPGHGGLPPGQAKKNGQNGHGQNGHGHNGK